jgi:hypothetical protein
MLFVVSAFVFVLVSIVLIKRVGIQNPFSKGVVLAAALAMISGVSLAQNYTHSLIPEANDGISISNQVAYWIIGEGGWSQESFKNTFEQSVYLTLLLIAAYPLVLLIESKLAKK